MSSEKCDYKEDSIVFAIGIIVKDLCFEIISFGEVEDQDVNTRFLHGS